MALISRWIVQIALSYPFFCGWSLVINVLHLLVLTRKGMRDSSTNVLMIGIALLDLYSMSIPVAQNVRIRYLLTRTCNLPDSYTTVYLSLVCESLRDDFVRSTNFLGLLMAAIRVGVIKSATGSSSWKIFNNASGAGFAWKTMLFVLVASSIISSVYFSGSTVEKFYLWKPYMDRCRADEFPANYSRQAYAVFPSSFFSNNDKLVERIYLFVDGLVSKIVPSILFPILTVIFIRQLQNVSQERLVSDNKKDKSAVTTKLITNISICFTISVMPLGVMYVAQSLCDIQCTQTMELLTFLSQILFPINSIAHFFLCVTISTQYKNALKSMFGIGTTNHVIRHVVVVTRNMY